MVQIWDFLRSFSVHFGSASQKCTETDLKKSQICPIWGTIWPYLGAKFITPGGNVEAIFASFWAKKVGFWPSWCPSVCLGTTDTDGSPYFSLWVTFINHTLSQPPPRVHIALLIMMSRDFCQIYTKFFSTVISVVLLQLYKFYLLQQNRHQERFYMSTLSFFTISYAFCFISTIELYTVTKYRLVWEFPGSNAHSFVNK